MVGLGYTSRVTNATTSFKNHVSQPEKRQIPIESHEGQINNSMKAINYLVQTVFLSPLASQRDTEIVTL